MFKDLFSLRYRVRVLFLICVFIGLDVSAQSDVIQLYVGESYIIEKTDVSLDEATSIIWEASSNDISYVANGFKVTVKPTKYFTGTESIVCRYTTIWGLVSSQTFYISCIDNPVSVSPTSVTLYLDGTKTKQLSYTHENNNYASAATITYNSSDASVATVSSSGKITAKKPGTAKIYVHSSLANDENAPYCEVTVVPPTLVLPKTKTINITASSTITPTQSPGSGFPLTWSSNNTAVATVNSSGRVTAKKKGTARITATVTGYEGYNQSTDYCDVTVTAYPTGAYFEVDTVTLAVGQQTRVLPIVTPTGAEYYITWATDNSYIATKDENGTVTGVHAGTTRISAAVRSLDNTRKIYLEYYVNVIDVLKGDVNGDHTINVEDVTLLISYLLHGNANNINFNNADVNSDGILDVSDVTRLIDIILHS